uniref:Selenide, water dikinase n=1 Tax=Lygus hesperus TaxID=30085 RepID=A0A146M2N3_LYGHE
MGKIACANVLSDLYAMGVANCDNMLMIVGIPFKMTALERDVVVTQMMKGFRDEAAAGGTEVTGGDTNFSEWCLVGGTATAVVKSEEVVLPYNAEVGDVLVLTKPLGTQNATFAYQWYQEGGEKWEKLSSVITAEEVQYAYFMAVQSMMRLNRTGASLMRRHHAHGATDITGFGLLGHANNLAKHQKQPVSFIINKLPIMCGMAAVERAINNRFMLLSGRGIETSGGLLIAMPKEESSQFCRSIKEIDGVEAWIIGHVVEGDRTASLDQDIEIIDVR